MKRNYFVVLLLLLSKLAIAQFITPTSYRGAFAPAPAAMWTDQWANFDPQNTVYPSANVVVSSNITTNTTWTANNTYKLSGQIFVTGNATLTIEPGTVILGDHTAVGACLLIAKGSKLIANGTASQPIVFTSDNAPGSRNKGDWGGVILLGKGAYNLNNGVANVEGLAASADTQYGGGLTPDNADNSGSLKYVRIEFPGYVYALNTEINGLTFGAVGSGTTIDYVQVSHSNDDSFEWFGGAVNCKHLIAYRGLDDDFDTDNGYSGNCQFGLGVRDPQVSDAPAVSTSEGFESDNNASSTSVTPYTAAIFTNFTMIGPNYRLSLPNGGTLASGYKRAARIRRNSQLKIYNSVFMDYNEGVHVDGLTTETNALNGTLQFRDNVIAGTVTTAKVYQVNTTGNNASFNIATWYAASNNTTAATNAGLLVNPYNSTSATIYTGLDYRPAAGSILLNSAHFDETAIGAATALVTPEVVSPVNLCYTQVASPLTATLLGGATSLKWYSVATGGTALATAPTPLTTVVGTKTYYVSQVRNGIESLRAAIVVNVNALPTTPGTITGTAAQGVLVGTSTAATYSIADVAGAVSYSWSVPAGVNIVSGQGTNTLVVNFLNVAAGAGTIGNLAVRSVNDNGCLSAAKTLSLTKALPTAPVLLSLTDGVTTTAITNISKYVGTTTALTLTVGTVATATGYIWNLPAGVNQVGGGANDRIIQVNFAGLPAADVTSVVIGVSSSNGVGVSATAKTLSLLRALPTAPLVLSMTNPASATPTTAITNVSLFIGTTTPLTLTASAVATAASYSWTLPAGVNQVGGGANDRIIQVNFADVPAGNSGVALPISIAAVNGVGVSPLKTLSLSRAVPTAPITLYLTDPASATPTTAITAASKYIGTSTTLTLTASAVTTATSYDWSLPAGVNQVGGGSHDRIIQVNFADVPAGNAGVALPISVYGVNGVGSSVAKTLSLTRVLPSAVVTVAGQIGAICGGNSYSYTMTAAVNATSYQITAPVGSIVTSASNPSNNSNVLTTSDLTFSVALPADFATLAVKTVAIYSKNGVGLSATAKTLTLNPAAPTVPAVNGGTTFTTCANVTFSVADMVGVSSFIWTVANGATIVSGQGTNTVEVSFASVTVASTLLRVKAVSTCGVAGADKYVSLTNAACATTTGNNTARVSNVTEVYPNPVVENFTMEMEANKAAAFTLEVYSFEGTRIYAKEINLAEGTNQVSENVSYLKKGLYIVKIVNQSTNEVVVKKMIKQ